MRKKRQQHVSHDRWLVSYADFITLLFAFFVVLYASAQQDRGKMVRLASAIEAAFQDLGAFQGRAMGAQLELDSGGASLIAQNSRATELARSLVAGSGNSDAQNSVEALRKQLEAALAPEIKRRAIALHIGPEGLVISLREMAFYASGSATLKEESLPSIARIATLLRQRQCYLRIEGHTDNIPIHTAQFASNWELSTARATEMIRLLVNDFAWMPDHLSAAGYGEFHPVAPNDSEEGRRLNRRIDIVVLGQQKASAASTPSTAGKGIDDLGR